MVIDFHAHCFPDSLAAKAMKSLEEGCYARAVHDGTKAGLKRHMTECGVGLSVVLPVATKPSQVNAINDWAAGSSDQSLLFFAAAHPDDADFYKNLEYIKKAGFPGIKLHPDYQNFYADEKRMFPIYEAIRDSGLIAVFHSGVDLSYTSNVHCTPLMLKNVLDNVPGIKIVAAHMGAHALWRDTEQLICGRDLYFDTSYSYYSLGREGMKRMIEKHGAGRILFGTDSPWKRADIEINNIHSLGLSSSDTENILFGNTLRLLGRL